jgi:hypothetical protein
LFLSGSKKKFFLLCSFVFDLPQVYLVNPKLRIEVRLTESLLSPRGILKLLEISEFEEAPREATPLSGSIRRSTDLGGSADALISSARIPRRLDLSGSTEGQRGLLPLSSSASLRRSKGPASGEFQPLHVSHSPELPKNHRMKTKDQFSFKLEELEGSLSPHQFSFFFHVLMNVINGAESAQLAHVNADIDRLLRRIPEVSEISGNLAHISFTNGNTIEGRFVTANLSGLEVRKSEMNRSFTPYIISTKIPKLIRPEG